jgi:hypothetical protein
MSLTFFAYGYDKIKYGFKEFHVFNLSHNDHINLHKTALKMVAASTAETSVNVHQITRRCNPEHSHLRTHRRENLRSYSDDFILSNVWLYDIYIYIPNVCLVISHLVSYSGGFDSNFGPKIG